MSLCHCLEEHLLGILNAVFAQQSKEVRYESDTHILEDFLELSVIFRWLFIGLSVTFKLKIKIFWKAVKLSSPLTWPDTVMRWSPVQNSWWTSRKRSAIGCCWPWIQGRLSVICHWPRMMAGLRGVCCCRLTLVVEACRCLSACCVVWLLEFILNGWMTALNSIQLPNLIYNSNCWI